jgi:hypothetical protein
MPIPKDFKKVLEPFYDTDNPDRAKLLKELKEKLRPADKKHRESAEVQPNDSLLYARIYPARPGDQPSQEIRQRRPKQGREIPKRG